MTSVTMKMGPAFDQMDEQLDKEKAASSCAFVGAEVPEDTDARIDWEPLATRESCEPRANERTGDEPLTAKKAVNLLILGVRGISRQSGISERDLLWCAQRVVERSARANEKVNKDLRRLERRR